MQSHSHSALALFNDPTDNLYPFKLALHETVNDSDNHQDDLQESPLKRDITTKFINHKIFGKKIDLDNEADIILVVNTSSELFKNYNNHLALYIPGKLLDIYQNAGFLKQGINYKYLNIYQVNGSKCLKLEYEYELKEPAFNRKTHNRPCIKAVFELNENDQFILTSVESNSLDIIQYFKNDAAINNAYHAYTQKRFNTRTEKDFLDLYRNIYLFRKTYAQYFSSHKNFLIKEIENNLNADLFYFCNQAPSLDEDAINYYRNFMLVKSMIAHQNNPEIKKYANEVLAEINLNKLSNYSIKKCAARLEMLLNFLQDMTNPTLQNTCLKEAEKSMRYSKGKIFAGAMICLVAVAMIVTSCILLGPVMIPALTSLFAFLPAAVGFGVGLGLAGVGGGALIGSCFAFFTKQDTKYSSNLRKLVEAAPEPALRT